MKLISPKLWRRRCYLHIGLLAFPVCFLLVSASLAQTADTSIVFISLRSDGRNSEIYRMDPDGKRLRRLTEQLGYDGAPTWSPDGQKITFTSFRDQHRLQERAPIYGEIYVMNADGTNPINLTQSPEKPEGASSWSPDGKQIAFQSSGISKWGDGLQWDIWVMEADGGNPRNLTNHHTQDETPDWSPNGNQIAFSSDRNRDWEFEIEVRNWEVYLMNTDGANPINLTKNLAWDSSPDWSPDGDRIAFASNRDGNSEVYVMNADGTNPINLTNHPATDDSPDWSPDGNQIAFQSDRDGNWEIYIMDADGANPINLTNHPAWDSSPSWESIHPLGFSSKGKLATLWGEVKHTQ